MATIIASLILATLCSGSLAAFLFPGPMGENGDYVTGVPEWTQGSNQTLKWKTDLDYYSIILWQQDYSGKWATSGPQVYMKLSDDPEIGDTTGFEWTVDPKSFNLTQSEVFWLNLRDMYSEDGSFKSTYFNISAASTTSSSSASSTATSPQTSAPLQLNTASPSSSPRPNSNDNTMKIALGVGLGVGIPIIVLLGAALFLGLRYMRRRSSKGSENKLANDGLEPNWAQKPELSAEYDTAYKQPQHAPPMELDGSSSPRELHVSSAR